MEGNSSVIEGGGEGDTGVTGNGVRSCVEGCLINEESVFDLEATSEKNRDKILMK